MPYHYRDGVYFNRLADGSVRVMKAPEQAAPVWDLVIDAESWPSIVAAMSAQGETAEAFRIAKELHGVRRNTTDD